MLGTDTLKYSSAKVVTDPWSGKPICLLPACYPDVAIIHVTRCDCYGNAAIDGTSSKISSWPAPARRLILTTEEIVPEEQIRDAPWRTVIPYHLVDAVIEAPFGCHPCQMPLRYYFDEDHIRSWMACSKTAEGTEAYLQEFVYSVADFQTYLEKIGGHTRLDYLGEVEALRA